MVKNQDDDTQDVVSDDVVETPNTIPSDVVEAEDEETRIPISYDTAEEALLSMFIQDEDVATLNAQM